MTGTTPTERPLAIEYWPIERLMPYARNARTHSPAQVAQIAASIRAFGFTNPILAGDAGDIVAGHGRLAAARQLGLPEVPVIVLRELSELQRRQLVLADNRIALNAGWDADMLRLELCDLRDLGADLSELGFTENELARAFNGGIASGLTNEDAVPAPPADAIARLGDTWLLGSHRIRCGDATRADDVAALFGTIKPPLMVTDPPYGVEYDPEWRHRLGVNASKRTGKVLNDERADWRQAWALFPGDVGYVWHGALRATTVAEGLVAAGFDIRAQIIWAKERLVIGRGNYHWQHEPCWYAVRNKAHWAGDRKQTTLWAIPNRDQDQETEHSTQKPVECMRRPLLNNSSAGQAVYDPFLGSGTTLIAAETTGRVCFGMELNPVYVDVSVKRWEAFTGNKASVERAAQDASAAAQEPQAAAKGGDDAG